MCLNYLRQKKVKSMSLCAVERLTIANRTELTKLTMKPIVFLYIFNVKLAHYSFVYLLLS